MWFKRLLDFQIDYDVMHVSHCLSTLNILYYRSYDGEIVQLKYNLKALHWKGKNRIKGFFLKG